MRSYRVKQEVDWKWLMKLLEVEMERRMLHYCRWGEEDSMESRQAYMNHILSFYDSLRSFLRFSPITKTRKKVEEFIKNGPGNRR